MSICIHNQVIRIQSPKTNGDMTYLIFCWRKSTSMPHSYSTLTVEACLQGWCNIFIIDFRWGWQVTRHWNLPGMKYFQISHGGPTQVFCFFPILVGKMFLKRRQPEENWTNMTKRSKSKRTKSRPQDLWMPIWSQYDWYNHKIMP